MQSITEDDVIQGKDFCMTSEKNRLASFKRWGIKTGKCTKENLAQSGYYHCHIKGEKNTVRCFVCFKTLNNLRSKDDPMTEHFEECYFAKLAKGQEELTLIELITVMKERNQNLNKLRSKYEVNKFEEFFEKFHINMSSAKNCS